MQCAICGADALFVCGRSGRPVCAEHSRIEVVSRLSFGSSGSLSVREATPDDYPCIGQLAEYFRGTPRISRFGREFDILKLPALVVSANDHVSGALSYSLDGDALVIAMLDVYPGYQGLGGGRMLVEAALEKAASEGKSEIRVAVENDDLPGIYFYQKNGFRIYEVQANHSHHSRDVKVGFAGIPVTDEIHLRRPV